MAMRPVQAPHIPRGPTTAWGNSSLGGTIERCAAWNFPMHLALALASCLQCVVGAVAKSAVWELGGARLI